MRMAARETRVFAMKLQSGNARLRRLVSECGQVRLWHTDRQTRAVAHRQRQSGNARLRRLVSECGQVFLGSVFEWR
jgi:3-methyladenine DNA glycosylase AlkC